MSREYCPDRWVMLKIDTDSGPLYKILAGWGGSYLYGDSWRLNSGCNDVKQDGEYFLFTGSSGSVYRCHRNAYGLTRYTSQILEQLNVRAPGEIEMLPAETDWLLELSAVAA